MEPFIRGAIVNCLADGSAKLTGAEYLLADLRRIAPGQEFWLTPFSSLEERRATMISFIEGEDPHAICRLH